MSGTKQPAGKAGTQSVRHFQVAPVARAVRLALAATTLALVGTGAAYAGTCSTTASTTQCTGDFTDTLSFPDAVDLTVIAGDGGTTPTSVTPAYGAAGIDVTGDGALDVTNYADVSTAGADGIHVYSTGSAHVTNDGSVTTYVDGIGQAAIDASANGNVGVTNNGYVAAYSYSAYDVTAVRAETVGCGCTATMDNGLDGSIVAYSSDASAIGVYAYADAGHVDVGNDGAIRAISEYGLADGVFAAGSSVDVRNTGYIGAQGYTWAAGIEAEGSDLTTVTNDGTVAGYARGYMGHGFGIYAAGGDGGVSVDNGGSVYANGFYSTGIDAHATGDVTVTNSNYVGSGSRSNTLYAVGIHAGSNGDGAAVSVTNDGLVVANSYYGSTGIEIVATGAGASGSVTNSGTVYAAQQSKYGSSAGIVVSADGDAHVDNSGSIYVVQGGAYGPPVLAPQGFTPYYGGSAYGVMALSFNGEASVTNTGDIHVASMPAGYAVGILVASQNSNASVDNDGSVESHAKYAYGIMASSGGGDVSVHNGADGNVYAASVAALPYAFAAGLAGIATSGDVSIDNAGTTYAISYGVALGELGVSGQGDVSEHNTGYVGAVAYRYTSVGMFARADNGVAGIENAGQVGAYSYYGDAVGLLARGGTAQATNTVDGTIHAYAYSNAYGIEAVGGTLASANNDGSIVVDSRSGAAIGIVGASTAGDVTIAGNGSIAAYASRAAVGIYGYAPAGTVTITNGGDISAVSNYLAAGVQGLGDVVAASNTGTIQATSHGGYAFGLYAAGITSVDATNSGSITVSGPHAFGVYVTGGALSVDNSGDIAVGSNFNATGIQAWLGYEGGSASLRNGGSVSAQGSSQALGIAAFGNGAGATASIINAGSVYTASNTKYGSAAGMVANVDGDAAVTNTGSIEVHGGFATGAFAVSNSGDASVVSSGDVLVSAGMLGGAIGLGATTNGEGVASIDNTGYVYVEGKYAKGLLATSDLGDVSIHNGATGVVQAYAVTQTAYAISARSNSGDVSIDNDGSLSAYSGTAATGIGAISRYAGVSVDNAGDVTAYGASMRAYGVFAYGSDDVTVDNSGTVSATSNGFSARGVFAIGGTVQLSNMGNVLARADAGGASAIGMYANAQTTAAIVNAGDIVAEAAQQAMGVRAVAFEGDASIQNGGTISAAATYGSTYAITAWSRGGDTIVSNTGTVSATAAQAAYGVWAFTYDNAVLDNATSGAITASGDRIAAGVNLLADQAITITNAGDINATAPEAAWGVYAHGGSVSIDNTGRIAAGGALADGFADGVRAVAAGSVAVHNSGTVYAASADAAGAAYGISARGYDILVDNAGLVSAKDADYAIAISLNADTVATVHNTGLIRTDSVTEGQIAVRGRDEIDQVLNYGQLDGALILNGGDDLVFNGANGVWNVGNHATDFGAGNDKLTNAAGGVVNLTSASIGFGDGDDAIVNGTGGTLLLHGGAISLGSSGDAGNSFTNNGTIRVVGTGNAIDMGTGPASTLVPSLNPLPLVNNGVIDFVDGVPDDVLTVTGDLDGHGHLQVDLRPLTHASDMLYVDGSIVSGSVQTVDVDFGGKLTSALLANTTAFAHVTGNSTAANFVGGRVLGYTPSEFLTIQVDVTSQIDASGAAADVFSVGATANGLSNTGSVAAALAPGAQSMVDSLIGTWRQRTGVQLDKGTIGMSPWFRMFNDRGSIDAGHVASNFGQGGTFGFDETNSGWELGLDVRPFDQVHVGLLLGESDGNQHLAATGSGAVNGQTFGVYGTWIGNQGFYVDTSFRWTGLTGRVRADGMQQYTDGEADSFNVEAGFGAWSLPGDFQLQPQVQYTHTSLDFRPLLANLTTFDGHDSTSSRGRVGVLFSKTIVDGGWTWVPYGSVNAIREFDGEYTYSINDDFVGTTRTKGTSALVELGLGVHKDKVTVSGGLNWTDGGSLNSFFGGQLVLRTTW